MRTQFFIKQKIQLKIMYHNSFLYQYQDSNMNDEDYHSEMKEITKIMQFFTSQIEMIGNEIEEYLKEWKIESFHPHQWESLNEKISRAESIIDRSLRRINRSNRTSERL